MPEPLLATENGIDGSEATIRTEELSDAAKEAIIQLPEIISGDQAANLADEILGNRGKACTIDACRVNRIDTPCICVLVAAEKLWALDGLPFRYSRRSEHFCFALNIVGLDDPSFQITNAVPRFKILTVDDSKTMRQLLRHCLVEAGFEVVAAEDGLDGLRNFVTSNPDLVITDLNMPQKDGMELIKSIRASDYNSRIPILVLSTESCEANRKRGRDIGATGWLAKPFDPVELVAMVNSLLPAREVHR